MFPDYYDISPPVGPNTAVWPQDVAFSRQVALDGLAGDHLTLSSITTTLHIGAHADAPSHFVATGASIDQVDLTPYMGPCLVMSCPKPRGSLIYPEDVVHPQVGVFKRLLIRTNSFPYTDQFSTDFVAFHPSTIHLLGQKGVILIGIDTPSVDAFDSKELLSHHALMVYGMRNLEGISLQGVPDGPFELIALPLKLANCDASPVRAVLRKLPGS